MHCSFFQLQKCEGIMERVKAIAFTDSVHSLSHHRADKKLSAWMKKVLGTDTGNYGQLTDRPTRRRQLADV